MEEERDLYHETAEFKDKDTKSLEDKTGNCYLKMNKKKISNSVLKDNETLYESKYIFR